MVRKAFDIVLASAERIAPDVLHFYFKRADGEAMDFIPGQFITLNLTHEEKLYRRSYSLANRQVGTTGVEFAASYVKGGIASECLFNLKPGDTLKATGPFGRLILPQEPSKRYILMATGTGITPYRAMLDSISARIASEGCEFLLLQGMRTREDLLYADEFCAFANEQAGFTYYPCLSRETPDERLPNGLKGYVTERLRSLDLSPEDDLVFLCGNPDMIDDAFAYLVDAGFATVRVKREKYISAK